ncbi:hypothetical protein V8G54_012563 [Vigna mungo]|uniref:25S rRNA (uridine-N(3))-methyltransferase BMT5-like domain-containing protein n=1 Tax=Vigna mungo TaxID=3915 RepID=A0AAQ3NTW8_VIGMU
MGDKRIAHYRSSHKILLVGEGDFSFSLCLAKAFGTAINMVATSLDSRSAQIHITHKTACPLSKWNIRGLAKRQRLLLVEEAEFYLDLYPGYSNKRGDRPNSDGSFPIGECSTFMFMSYFDRFL